MTDILDALRILLLIAFPLSGLITYLVIVNTLTKKGNKLSNGKTHVFNLLDFLDLIHSTTEGKEKRHYKRLLTTFIISIVLFIGTGFSFIYELMQDDCHDFTNYLRSETQGQVIDKFDDPKNHLIKTLTILYNGVRYNDSDLTLPRLNLSDSIKIGDNVKKLKGDSIIYIIRDNIETKIIRTKKDICKN
jgi:hypothetical protein